MINQLNIKNFKLFREEIQLKLSNLTLLTGLNGRGKSSVIQALLLIKQSYQYDKSLEYIVFDSNLLELGSFEDIRNVDENVTISIFQEGIDYLFSFYSIKNNDLKAELTYDRRLDISSLIDNMRYISADRGSPKLYYKKSVLHDEEYVGKNGEYTASVLFENREKIVQESLLLKKDTTPPFLLDQTGLWIERIFGSHSLNISNTIDTIVEITFSKERKNFKPVNVGFGYSYVLPIIVAGLLAKEGDILLIDTPEAHLHPSAQSRLAKFLAKISTLGVQIIIETHSDHIVNGFRVSLKHKVINEESFVIQFFNDTGIEEVKVTEEGEIKHWPDGFFDQDIKDEDELWS